MRYIFVGLTLLISSNAIADSADLATAIENTRAVCGAISGELNHLKTMAGINTAVTGVGTVAGGVALGTGIAKANVDKDIEKLEAAIAELNSKNTGFPDYIPIELDALLSYNDAERADADTIPPPAEPDLAPARQNKEKELAELTKKSKTLGNIRTGTLATATATNIAGTVIAVNNRVDADLQSRINACIASVKTLQQVRMQARLNGDTDPVQMNRAEQIEKECGAWQYVNLSSINSKSTGATISSSVGAAMGLTGTITSAMANSNSVRNDNTDTGKSKEKNLNNTANIMAGGTTVASGVATIFNATQIKAIKNAVNTATECEEAL